MSDTDNNYYQLPESNRRYVGLDCDPRNRGISAASYDDLLKISRKESVSVVDFLAESDGSHFEDGVDINNRCRHVLLSTGKIGAGRKGVAVTIKGGSTDITIINCTITRPGKRCDIEIGNHSDQSWAKCTGILIANTLRSDGKPVRVAWGRGTKPTIIGGNARIAWGWTICLHLYVYAKHFCKFIP